MYCGGADERDADTSRHVTDNVVSGLVTKVRFLACITDNKIYNSKECPEVQKN